MPAKSKESLSCDRLSADGTTILLNARIAPGRKSVLFRRQIYCGLITRKKIGPLLIG